MTTQEPKKKPVRRVGRVSFLARAKPIEEGLAAGRTKIDLYDRHGKETGLGYSQFCRYIDRYILKKPKKDAPRKEPENVGTPASPSGFAYDAVSERNKEDLI